MKLLEECILTFRVFLKKDKKKSSVLMGVHGHTGSSIQQVQSSLDKVRLNNSRQKSVLFVTGYFSSSLLLPSIALHWLN
uniref:Uncharacterized protein n=1 Tax=Aegilops tauschii subsp. strangulata TaxID=200361 RepID=A0A453RL07_AEGTS